MKSKVAIVRCDSYNPDEVYNSLSRALNLLGGIDKFVRKQDRILLKPNILMGTDPAKCVSTHPAVMEAIIKILKENKYKKIYYGDSPSRGNPEKEAEKAGLKQIADKLKIKHADFSSSEKVHFKKGRIAKSFIITKNLPESIINLPKMKAHQLTTITGAVKNTFGCVHGLNKAAYHATYPDADSFSKMLIDLNQIIKPKLHIMDGIVAMEGNGPASGTPRNMNVLLVSADPVALDATFCRLINIKPEIVPTNKYGQEYGLGTYKNIALVGDDIEKLKVKDFDSPKRSMISRFARLMPFVRKLIMKKPVIDPELCKICGICVEACPVKPKALKNIKDKPPIFNYDRCIRCYCCQEMCPHKSIYVKTPLLGKLFYRK